MSNANLSLVPAIPLNVAKRDLFSNSDMDAAVLSSNGAEDFNFILFGQDWLEIQTFCAQALKLPITTSDWNNRYGSFSSQSKVDSVLTGLKSLNGLANDFGNPTTIKDLIIKDKNYLTSVNPPKEIYDHIIWLSNKIQNTANTFSYTLSNLKEVLSPDYEPDPVKRANNLKAILVGNGGLKSSAVSMSDKTKVLQSKLLTFGKSFEDESDKVRTYLQGKDSIITEASGLVEQFKKDIDTYTKSADNAYKKWRDYTIAASTTSVGVLVLSFGLAWPIAVGLGAGLGAAAALARKDYNDYHQKIAAAAAEKLKKSNLVTDLGGLNNVLAGKDQNLTKFQADLGKVQSIWTTIDMNLNHIVENYGVEQLSDYAWIMQALKIDEAQKEWKEIAASTKQFTENSLVTFQMNVNFGQSIA